MAKRIFQAVNFTPTATADTTAMANGTYMAIKPGSATQMIEVQEIMVSGFAATSSPTILQFARSSTVATTPTALAAPNSDGPMHPSTAALAAVPVTFVAAGAGTQRDATTTSARLNLGLNAFGGIVRWVAAQGAPFTLLGQTQPLGEASLSAFTGGTVGAISAHIIYEPY
jgi:hypothetical protein